ncbi:ABC-F family ATP-binding cassette domain-containing protein [Pedobacter sp. Du54]|uniref:ABC-F family ATP-binding cassette domain-containing protein n=1 Tax=Pedobacter anseongensis TaxID=3133439 RepID=UPI0030B34625
MFTLHHISYSHLDGDVLFDQLNFTVQSNQKSALVGTNGSGKSTLMKIIAGELKPASGTLAVSAKPYLVPQHFGQYNHQSIAQALRLEGKLSALFSILEGQASEENFTALGDDWSIEERCQVALSEWGLEGIDLASPFSQLSGGEKTKVFLAGMAIHLPGLILLDEPTNHLDIQGRKQLYAMIENTRSALLVASHDRSLLNLLDQTHELSRKGVRTYGGNYDFYVTQKQIEEQALTDSVAHYENALLKARLEERETSKRQQKLDARGKKKQQKSGTARIMMNTLRNKAENSTAKSGSVHTDKIAGIVGELQALRYALAGNVELRFGFSQNVLHHGKVLFRVEGLAHSFNGFPLFKDRLDLQLLSGERIALKGANGSGKTTLLRIVLGRQAADAGKIYRNFANSVYIDQEYSLIDNSITVFQQLSSFHSLLSEHELKSRLDWFLFGRDSWDRHCGMLSGGEKMRLMLCCLSNQRNAPELIVLDEPTNNLDLQSLAVLTVAIRAYTGTLLVVSHDELFLKDIGCEREIVL